MTKKRSCKKGSSLLMVVAMMSILSILILSILAMTTSGYKLRLGANQRVESFYGADSGLEISEKVIYDYISVAIKYSNEKAKTGSDLSNKKKIFEESFKNFLVDGNIEMIDLPYYQKGSAVSKYIYSDIKSEVKIQEYYDFVGRKDVKIEETKLEYKSIKEKKYMEVNNKTLKDDIDGFKLYVKSSYTKDGKSRVVSVEFEIEIPEYGKTIISANKAKSPEILNYIFGADGNYNFDINTGVNALGDIWVKGKDRGVITKENKYKSGINMYSSENAAANMTWDGDIVTVSNLVVDNVILNMGGKEDQIINGVIEDNSNSIFAENVVLNYESSIPSNIDMLGRYANVYVYNDFVSNIKDKTLRMKNFYGINDLSDYNDLYTANLKLSEAERSSSILINSRDESKIIVEKDAYILGTSYLDLTKAYQTGQSVVMNQLSKPYSIRKDGYIYRYDSKGNIQIIDEKTNIEDKSVKLSLADKRKLAIDYYTNHATTEERNMADKFNIDGNLYNTGVVLATTVNGKIHNQNISFDKESDYENSNDKYYSNKTFEEEVKKLQATYAKEVFNMNADGKFTYKDFINKDLNKTVSTSFDWKSMSEMIEKYSKCPECLNCEYNPLNLGNYRYKCTCEICKVNGCETCKEKVSTNIIKTNSKNFMHLETKAAMKDIILDSKASDIENSLKDYSLVPGIGELSPQVILNSSNKKIVIEEVRSIPLGKKVFEEDDNEIRYYIKDRRTATDTIFPVLVISNAEVIYKTSSGSNHTMLIGCDDVTLKILDSPAKSTQIGNYGPQSSKGEFKIINELFKYSLETNEIMGDIGGNIFEGNNSKDIINSMEISDLVKTKQWTLIS